MVGTAGGPAAAAISRAAQPEGHVFSHISEAGEVGGVAVRAERDRGVAAEVVGPGAGHGRIIREPRDPGDEAARESGRPRLPAVERRVDAAAVVVVPVVVSRDHVDGIYGIEREGSLVLGGGIAADVDDVDRAAAR